MKRFYYIIARRPYETVYYCSSPTQGRRMIPRALSMARRFDTRKEAKEVMAQMAEEYKGLTDWKVNTACEEWIE